MGCDIHAYLEYKNKGTDKGYWQNFGAQFRLDRNYLMFGLLANVRNDGAIIQPKGIPDGLAYEAEGDLYLRINDEYKDDEGYCSLERALHWQKNGETIVMNDGKPYKITHPDWHSHSWLTLDEFKSVLDAYEAKCKESIQNDNFRWGVEYRALYASMKSLSDEGFETRLIFWFDN